MDAMRKRIILIGVVIIAIILLYPHLSKKYVYKEAEQLVDEYFNKSIDGDYEGVADLFRKENALVMPWDDFVMRIKYSNTHLGEIQNWTLLDINSIEASEDLNIIYLTYKVERPEYPSKESFIIYHNLNEDSLKIYGYDIVSEGFR
ncbi:MAG: hypothetical protein ABH851_01875 [Methanobacteriota archaeon]